MTMMNRIFMSVGLLFVAGFYSLTFAQVKKKVQTIPTKKITTVKKTNTKPMQAFDIPGNTKVKIHTDMGDIVIRLYDATPKHRDNFVKLVEEKFYDSLLFHRIIQGFMIQGGDPLSKNAQPGAMLGSGGGDMERIPAEFDKNIIHKKGALAAARDGNPEKASSACQFYLVQGNVISDDMLNQLEQQKGIKYSPAQRNIYKTIGGTPFLDMEYTVYGEVMSGLEVIDKIATAEKNQYDRPNADIHMSMELISK